MASPIVDVRCGLREAFEWTNLRRFLVAIFVIALFLSLVFGDFRQPNWHVSLIVTFVFTFFIAWSIYLFLNILKLERLESQWKRNALTGIAIVLSGWFGDAVAVGVLYSTLDVTVSHTLGWFVSNTVLILFFGAGVYGYFVLRERLQISAARLAEKEVNEQRLQRLRIRAELEALRAKINPHFLFNTLNSIASLIPSDPQKAEEMVQKLSHLLRYTLDASGSDMTTLKEELGVIREYLEIEKTRLGRRLSYYISMDDDLADLQIPGMVLQPLVENSVKHGIAPLSAAGWIRIVCSKSADDCEIEIRDNGAGIQATGEESGFGLGGVRERLALLYGPDAGFSISDDNGVCVKIRIPLRPRAARSNRTSVTNPVEQSGPEP